MGWIRALILCSMLSGVAAAQAPPASLQPGTPIETSIGGGQTHNYTVNADEKSAVQITVEQHGVDVVVSVFNPKGKKLGEYDTPNGTEGPENLSFVIIDEGAYRVEVTPLMADARSGRYQIKIGEIREATEEELKAAKNLERLKANALALLDEIEGIIVELRVPQSRIRAQLQAAQLLWAFDERRAKKYATEAINTYKELVTALDSNTKDYPRSYSELYQLRFEIAYSLMARQPELALNFVRSTPPLAEPYGNRRQVINQQAGLEAEIINRIAMADPKRAFEAAREILKSGYSQNLIGNVENLRAKRPDLAAELAGEIANKLLNDKLLKNPEALSLAASLIRMDGAGKRNQSADQNAQGRRLLSEQQQRDLLQKILNEVMAYKPSTLGYSQEREQAVNVLRSLQSMGTELDGVLTGGASALEKKVTELSGPTGNPANAMFKYQNEVNSLPVDDALAAITRAPKEFQESLYAQLANRVSQQGDTARARQILNEHISNSFQLQQVLRQMDQQDASREASKGKIDEALRVAANLPTAEERASTIAGIVNQIGPGLKRAEALKYLDQARALLSPSVQAQGQFQLNALLEIVKGFSRYDAKRGFEILDPLVDQFNDIADAARVLQGFGWEFYEQDELNMGNGNAVANAAMQLSQTIGALAVVDFDRAKLTADRIKLPEVRLRSYIEIAQKALSASG